MQIEEKYIHLEDWSFSKELIDEIQITLDENKLANLLVLPKGNEEDLDLANALNELLLDKNGLACFYSKESMKPINDLKLDCTIGLPTHHEAVEAVMMNILENEFLSLGN